jgi:hypothetical protein
MTKKNAAVAKAKAPTSRPHLAGAGTAGGGSARIEAPFAVTSDGAFLINIDALDAIDAERLAGRTFFIGRPHLLHRRRACRGRARARARAPRRRGARAALQDGLGPRDAQRAQAKGEIDHGDDIPAECRGNPPVGPALGIGEPTWGSLFDNVSPEIQAKVLEILRRVSQRRRGTGPQPEAPDSDPSKGGSGAAPGK